MTVSHTSITPDMAPANLTDISVSLTPPQMSMLELTLQASKQNGAGTREVVLVLVSNTSVLIKLQAPEIPWQLAYVSV